MYNKWKKFVDIKIPDNIKTEEKAFKYLKSLLPEENKELFDFFISNGLFRVNINKKEVFEKK